MLREVAEREGQGQTLHVSWELFWIGVYVAPARPVSESRDARHVRRPSRAREPH